MSHPFLSLSSHQRKAFFWFLIPAALSIAIVMQIMGEPLVTAQAPYGIVSFELAGTPAQAQLILDSWDARAKQYAAFGLGFDYLFMLAYSAAIGLGCLLAAGVIRGRGWPLASLGVLLAWGMWLAALLDAVENFALLQLLLAGTSNGGWPAVARLCAVLKFGLIFLGLVYVMYGLATGLLARLRR